LAADELAGVDAKDDIAAAMARRRKQQEVPNEPYAMYLAAALDQLKQIGFE
jgi:hypothetical protein